MNTLQAYFKAPSNIALIKYWGKREIQIPENTSISFTLKNCVSKTKIICKNRNADKNISVFFEGKKQ
jgi:diphosphomevalonate decarboxylase